MKRLCTVVVLMALSPAAQARDSFSFVFGGHRIRIEASSHCRSASCVSVSIPGIYQTRRWRDRRDDDEREVAAPVKPPVAAPVAAVPPAAVAPAAPVPAAPVISRPVAPPAQEVAAPPPVLQPAPPPPAPPPALMTPPEPPPVAAPATPERPPQILQAVELAEAEPVDTPLGDWRSEGNKGSVRIERCGGALCGYALHAPSTGKGEAVLINMKPKTDSQWTGNVYSVTSGDTYYGTMTMTGPNALRVEACALGRFYCSGNDWKRIAGKPERLITSTQVSPEPRS